MILAIVKYGRLVLPAPNVHCDDVLTCILIKKMRDLLTLARIKMRNKKQRSGDAVLLATRNQIVTRNTLNRCVNSLPDPRIISATSCRFLPSIQVMLIYQTSRAGNTRFNDRLRFQRVYICKGICDRERKHASSNSIYIVYIIYI